MSLARLKRLQRLEARKPKAFVPVNYAAHAASLRWLLTCYAAVATNKACLMPKFGPMPAPSDAKRAALQLLDQTAGRLAQERHG